MKKLLIGLAGMPFLVGVAMAGQSMPLSEAQMDRVTAGTGTEFNIIGVGELTVGLTFEPGLSLPNTFQGGGPNGNDDPHTFCIGCNPANFEPIQGTRDLIVPRFGPIQIGS